MLGRRFGRWHLGRAVLRRRGACVLGLVAAPNALAEFLEVIGHTLDHAVP